MALSAAARARLSPSQFGCPSSKKFPLDTKKRAANAHARWHNPLTKQSSKCAGGHTRIVKAECRLGVSPGDRACPIR